MITLPSFLTRPRFVLTQITLLILLLAASVFVPQEGSLAPSFWQEWQHRSPFVSALLSRTGLTNVHTSLPFFVTLVLILVSLSATVTKQTRRLLLRPSGQPKAAPRSVAMWAGVIFHCGLITLTLAGIGNYLFLQRGYVQVMSGEQVRNVIFQSVELGKLMKIFQPEIDITVSSIEISRWEDGTLRSLHTKLTTVGGETTSVAANRPLSLGEVTIHQSLDFGDTVTLLLRRRDGSIQRTFFLLDPTKANRLLTDIPGTGYDASLHLLRPNATTTPILHCTLLQGKQVIFDGLLLPGSVAPLPEGSLLFEDVSPWSGLIIQKQRDRLLAYLGLLLCCTGAAMFCYQDRRKFA